MKPWIFVSLILLNACDDTAPSETEDSDIGDVSEDTLDSDVGNDDADDTDPDEIQDGDLDGPDSDEESAPDWCYGTDGSRIDTNIPQTLDTVEYWRTYYALRGAGCSTAHLNRSEPICNNSFYVAPDGDDEAQGTEDRPLATIPAAHDLVEAGDCIILRGGTHFYSERITIRHHNGEQLAPIRLMAYEGETPVLDFSAGSETGIELIADYWHIYGLTIQNAGNFGLFIYGGSYNVIEEVTLRENAFSGLGIKSRETSLSPTGFLIASHNKVINCDSYDNFDPQYDGENADGFEVKISSYEEHLIPGPGNEFVGCRAWGNSDDGWDFWYSEIRVIIDSCWAFDNGFNVWGHEPFTGDGNGFKYGKNIDATSEPTAHLTIRSLAFGNAHGGFNENDSEAPVTLINNTAWNNALIHEWSGNYTFPYHPAGHVIINNVSFEGTHRFDHPEETTLISNSWQLPEELTIADFSADVSLEDALIEAKAPRQDSGALPELSFVIPSGESAFCDVAHQDIEVVLYSHDGSLDIGFAERR